MLNRARHLVSIALTRTPLLAWIPAVTVIAFAALLRLHRLDAITVMIFDEKWYVPQAYSLTKVGYETKWPDQVQTSSFPFDESALPLLTTEPQMQSHAPLGKWLIAAGMELLGPTNPYGWRLMSVIFGTLMVALVIAIGYRLTRSHGWALLAGAVVAVDAHAITLSRLAILDIFVATFALAGVYCMLEDAIRRRPPYRLRTDPLPAWRRPWLVTAALMFGAATSVKGSGVVFFAVFAVFLTVDEYLQRRALPRPVLSTVQQTVRNATLAIPVYLSVYLASWTGWLMTSGGMDRNWAAANPPQGLEVLIPDALRSLIHYQIKAYRGDAGISHEAHGDSVAYSWPFMGYPTSLYTQMTETAGGDPTFITVSSAGNPVIWWLACLAVLAVAVTAVVRRNVYATIIILGFLAGWAPWLFTGARTVYHTYSIAFLPYMILALVLAIRATSAWALRQPHGRRTRRFIVTGFLLTVLAVGLFFWPTTFAIEMTAQQWLDREWITGWGRDLFS
jgi:dolichyl-phosphate-mannose-protein mannosyltransferase